MSIAIRMGLWGMPASTRDWKDYLEKLIRKKKKTLGYLLLSQRVGLRMVGKSGINISILLMKKLSFIENKSVFLPVNST